MPVTLTSKAKEKLDELYPTMEENKALRIYIVSVGWGGRSFGMALDEPKENDLKLEVDGYKFVLDAALEKTYGKFTVDYSNWFLNRGFDISHRRTYW